MIMRKNKTLTTPTKEAIAQAFDNEGGIRGRNPGPRKTTRQERQLLVSFQVLSNAIQ